MEEGKREGREREERKVSREGERRRRRGEEESEERKGGRKREGNFDFIMICS